MGKGAEKNQKNWQKTFEELQVFKAEHGCFPNKKDSQRLYTWCAVQRLKKKKEQLSADKCDKLNSIGFVWNVQDHIWNKNFELLLEYRENNPGRWPSQRSKEPVEHKLAVWFLGIRKDYKRKKLSKERINRLEEIGFPFYPREYRWDQTYQHVKDWLHKHQRFPQRGSKSAKEQKLFNWCRYQVIKREYEVLEDRQVSLLEELGIDQFVRELKDFEKARAEAKRLEQV